MRAPARETATAATKIAPTPTMRPCAATPNAIASSECMPAATRIAAPAPACIAAPAGAIGSTAAAEAAHTNASASAKSAFIPSAASSTKIASARSVHETAIAAQAATALLRRRRVVRHPAGEAEAREPANA